MLDTIILMVIGAIAGYVVYDYMERVFPKHLIHFVQRVIRGTLSEDISRQTWEDFEALFDSIDSPFEKVKESISFLIRLRDPGQQPHPEDVTINEKKVERTNVEIITTEIDD